MNLLARFFLTTLLIALALPAGAQSGRTKPKEPPTRRAPERPRTVNPSPTPTPAPADATPLPTVPTSEEDGEAPARIDRARPQSSPAPESSSRQSPPTHTGAPKPDEIDDGDVVRISANLVPVPATVLDAQGRAVLDLDLEDFELKVDGSVRPIGDLSRDETPVTLALLYDNSSSLRAGREFEKKAAVAFFRRVMRPADRAAIYSVSTEPELSLPLTSDVRALVRTIENFGRPEGATALFDAVAEAALYLKPQRGRKVIVIVSDGTDTVSDLSFDETLARVVASDCQVYAVQTGHSDSPNLRDLAGERRLEEFAANTGGAVYAPRSTTDFERAFAQIAADLAQQYIIGYYPSDARRDGSFHPLSLRVTTRANLRVRTRKGYYSPKG